MISDSTIPANKTLDDLSDDELNNLDMKSLLDLGDASEWVAHKGEVITGQVVQVDSEYIYLNYGQKAEGRVLRSEVAGDVNIHDNFNAIIIQQEGSEGLAQLSIVEANKKIAWDRLTTEEDITNLIVEGKIQKAVNGGFLVTVSGLSFFLPGSQLGGIKIKDISEVINKTYDFKVIKIDYKRKSGVLSRRQLLDDRREEKWKNFIVQYKETEIVKGIVKGITDYGAFVEVDDIKGLLHISDITWKKNANPKDYVKKNSEIEVKILNIDQENRRISFGLKQLSEDPWQVFLREHSAGEQIKGIVTQLVAYGAFVELLEGVEGLVHLSELSWSRRVNHPKQVLKKGDEVSVSILKIDEAERKVSLSLKDVLENPWEKVAENFQMGQILKGKITKVTNFGAFVEIEKDVEGLIHVNDLSWEENSNPKKVVNEGDEVEFKIMEMITEERKIACSIKHLIPSPWELLKEKYPPRTVVQGKVTGVVPFGLFLEIEKNVEGLVHISHIRKGKEDNISDKFKKGDELTASVISVDTGKKRISLSIKDYEKQQEKRTLQKYMKDPDNQKKMTLGDLINLKPGQ